MNLPDGLLDGSLERARLVAVRHRGVCLRGEAPRGTCWLTASV
jgi:hypothetical protein